MFEVDCIFHCNNVSNHKGLGVCRFIGKLLQGFTTFRVGPTLSGAFMLDVVLANQVVLCWNWVTFSMVMPICRLSPTGTAEKHFMECI